MTRKDNEAAARINDAPIDADQLQRMLAGDGRAYAGIVCQFESRLFALTAMITRDPGAAEEVAQDAFMRAWQNLDRYDPSMPFYPWLATIAVRLASNWSARVGARVRQAGSAGVDVEDLADPAAGPLARSEALNRGRDLWTLVEQLPAGERIAVLLFYRQDLSVADIAMIVGVSAGTVKTSLFRARRHLRAHLAEEAIDGL